MYVKLTRKQCRELRGGGRGVLRQKSSSDPMSMRKPNFVYTAKATLPTKDQTFTHLHILLT
jgi:hypothetical protein